MTDNRNDSGRAAPSGAASPRVRRLVAYRRVSTNGQAESGFGLDIQKAKIEGWAKANGYSLVADFADEGVSGSLENRLGVLAAIRSVSDGAAEGIVVARLDRWARDVIVQESLRNELVKAGGELYSTVEAEQNSLSTCDDPADGATRRLVRVVLGAIAEYDRAMVSLRMAAGREAKRASGKWWSGAFPYGWRADGEGTLVPVADQQEMIAWMVRQKAAGFTYDSIVERLNDAGVAAPRGERWHPSTVKRIIARARSGEVAAKKMEPLRAEEGDASDG